MRSTSHRLVRSTGSLTSSSSRLFTSCINNTNTTTANYNNIFTCSSTRFFSSSSTATSKTATSPSDDLPSSIYRTDCGLYVDRSLPANFTKILIANRGEIACRVIRTCRELGVKTVAIYSDADANARFVQMADEAYRIGEPAAAKSYLLGDKIIEICKLSGAQAIHPGYGFLSENASFARLCEDNGVVFIGPPTTAIEAMGSKSASKNIMLAANVPCVPGYHGDNQDREFLRQEAVKIGYPVMMKAVLGGGGKGMRIVHQPQDFDDMFDACRREAMASFKDDRLLLEKYIVRPRHIEFQVFADKHGNAIHFCERDCSVQRRHQKVLEEAPAPGMSEELRAKMGKSACEAAKAVGYVGAGTVEFIFDADTNDYYFMEMNTRLQVEHPVTEMIMRRDLVQLQLHVAAGHKLPVQQSELKPYGYAIEARVYAENPYNNFLPATGKLKWLRTPLSPSYFSIEEEQSNKTDRHHVTEDISSSLKLTGGSEQQQYIRVESGVRMNDEVSIFYDPMIAKLLTWGNSRQQALERMADALRQYQIVGPPTNISFLLKCVQHPEFQQGQVTTNFIASNFKDLVPKDAQSSSKYLYCAIMSLLLRNQHQQAMIASTSNDPHSLWNQPNARRVNGHSQRTIKLLSAMYADDGQLQHHEKNITITYDNNNQYRIRIDQEEEQCCNGRLIVSDPTLSSMNVMIGGRQYKATVVQDGADIHVFVDGQQARFRLPEVNFTGGDSSHGSGCLSPMAGKVVKVNVESKQSVKKGQPLVIMEAMKMEHIIRAPYDGIIDKILYQVNDFVEGGKVVVTFVKENK